MRLKDFLKETLELGRDDVFKVDCKESFSFFNTDEAHKEKIMEFFKDFKVDGRFVNVEISNNTGGGRRDRGGRGRGRGGRKDGDSGGFKGRSGGGDRRRSSGHRGKRDDSGNERRSNRRDGDSGGFRARRDDSGGERRSSRRDSSDRGDRREGSRSDRPRATFQGRRSRRED